MQDGPEAGGSLLVKDSAPAWKPGRLVLPPLLYASAVHMPAIDFRRDFTAISGLAVLLVAVTTLCCGLVWLSKLRARPPRGASCRELSHCMPLPMPLRCC